jgi:hypothetical protein
MRGELAEPRRQMWRVLDTIALFKESPPDAGHHLFILNCISSSMALDEARLVSDLGTSAPSAVANLSFSWTPDLAKPDTVSQSTDQLKELTRPHALVRVPTFPRAGTSSSLPSLAYHPRTALPTAFHV